MYLFTRLNKPIYTGFFRFKWVIQYSSVCSKKFSNPITEPFFRLLHKLTYFQIKLDRSGNFSFFYLSFNSLKKLQLHSCFQSESKNHMFLSEGENRAQNRDASSLSPELCSISNIFSFFCRKLSLIQFLIIPILCKQLIMTADL